MSGDGKKADQGVVARCPWCSPKPGGPLPPERLRIGMQMVKHAEFVVGLIFCGDCYSLLAAQIIGQEAPLIAPGVGGPLPPGIKL